MSIQYSLRWGELQDNATNSFNGMQEVPVHILCVMFTFNYSIFIYIFEPVAGNSIIEGVNGKRG